ncbi:MAG TPA: NADPH:quinone oxidoreductase family protein [Longimicrobiales bacterium]|nr:NADPH:quinone oxidoreductase family protein [Longimicrobiales bacterium]
MRAYQLTRHGPPEVLRPTERPDPRPGAGEVRVRVETIGVNYAEILSRKGLYGWAPKLPYVLGMEAAGTIDEVGEGARRSTGEAVVVGMQHGAYATAVVVREAAALPAIEGFSPEENAAFPVNYVTAWAGLVESGRLRAGDRVLVSPAGGGVGTAAVQIAHRHGCTVVAAAGSDAKLERVRALGADAVVNYRAEGWERRLRDAAGPEGIDIALEMVGGEVFRAATGVLAPFGRIVVAGYASLDYKRWNPASLWRAWRGLPRMGLREMLTRSVGMSSSHIGFLLPHAGLVGRMWDDVVAFVAEHGVRPQVGHVLPFEAAAEAHRLIESRGSYGKVVLRV